MYVARLFSVLHQQINCCFILVLANNQNIIMELVAHGGTIFYSVHTHRQAHALIHACTQKQAGTKQLPPPPPPLSHTCLHTLTHTHMHPREARVHCSLMPPIEPSLDFVSLLSCIFSEEWWEVGSAVALSSLRDRRELALSLGSCSPKPRPWPSQPKS